MEDKPKEDISKKNISPKKNIYDLIYPGFKLKELLNNNLKEELATIEEFKENFNILKINQIFDAFLVSYNSNDNLKNYVNFDYVDKGDEDLSYYYDGFEFKSTIYRRIRNKNNKKKKIIEIKLSNNGFIYKKLNKNGGNCKVIRHNHYNWIYLDDDQIDIFSSINSFLVLLISQKIIDKTMYLDVLYNNTCDRLDFYFYDKDDLFELSINYELGYPENGKRYKLYSDIRKAFTPSIINMSVEDINKRFYGEYVPLE